MKGYILKILGIFLILGISEIMLPEGSIKKYAKVILSILVCSTLLSDIGVLPRLEIDTEIESAKIEDTFENEVLKEYKKRIEENIFENSGERAEVILNGDGGIEKVTVFGGEALKYVKNCLGVSENDIETYRN